MARKNQFYKKYAKRLLDIAISGSALVALSPVMGVTALLIKKKLGSPVIFHQERPGKDEKFFRMYKFRSMTNARDLKGNLLPDEERLTRFGRILRRTSLDELPELWNILRGDMSIVGPRPLLTRYLPRYSAEQRRRHQVRPGLTGWAQINGRNAIDWEKKLMFDVWYVDHCSLRLDIEIFVKTLLRVAQCVDISHENAATMPEFMGTSGTEREAP